MSKKNNNNYVKWKVFRLIIGGLFGILLLIYYQVDINRDRVSDVEGDIKVIRETMRWLEETKEDYERKNGKFNFEGFMGSVLVQSDLLNKGRIVTSTNEQGN